MPGISRQTAAHHDDHGPVLDIHEDLGDLSVKRLPDDAARARTGGMSRRARSRSA